MKKIIGTVFVLALLTSCGGGDESNETTDMSPEEVETVTAEVNSIDSMSVVLEEAANEIEQSVSKLDAALNEL